jgi:peptidoglycan/xylan/chitin deacetylase (PgdA/CDA1 family)
VDSKTMPQRDFYGPAAGASLRDGLRGLRRRAVRAGLVAAAEFDVWPRIRAMAANSLSVLLYHRIADPQAPDFFGLAANVSATRRGFAEQLEYLKRHYRVISLDHCIDWAAGKAALPRNAVLITFDDGYRDNLSNALPELAERHMNAVLFVATGYVAGARVFFWDWAADAFRRTQMTSAELPILGRRQWRTGSEQQRVAHEWVDAAKRLPERERLDNLQRLSVCLQVPGMGRAPAGVHLDWEEIRQLANGGFAIGAHSVTHPMLNRTRPDEAEWEMRTSRQEIEQQLSRPVTSFAYPFGGPGEFDPSHEQLLRRVGFAVGFRSTGGISFARDAQRRPFAIRRISVGLRDDLPRFAARVAGTSRLTGHA